MSNGSKMLAFACAAFAWVALSSAPQPSFDLSLRTIEAVSRQQLLQQPRRVDIARNDGPANLRTQASYRGFLKRLGFGDGKLSQEPSTPLPVLAHSAHRSVGPEAANPEPHLVRSSNRPRAPPRLSA